MLENIVEKGENSANECGLVSKRPAVSLDPYLSSVECFQFRQVKNMLFYKLTEPTSLTLSQTTNFRLFQIERVCRRQFQIQ